MNFFNKTLNFIKQSASFIFGGINNFLGKILSRVKSIIARKPVAAPVVEPVAARKEPVVETVAAGKEPVVEPVKLENPSTTPLLAIPLAMIAIATVNSYLKNK